LRNGVLRMDGESEADYIKMFKNDHAHMTDIINNELGIDLSAFSYPYGEVDVFSSILLRELGIDITFSIEPGMNTLVKGLPQSLLELKRFNMTNETTGMDLITMIKHS